METHVDQIRELGYYPDKPKELQQKMGEIGLKFANISNDPPLNGSGRFGARYRR